MDNLTYECYLTLSGRLLLNRMLAGDKLVLTRAVGSSMTTEAPENLLEVTPENHYVRQFMAVANGDYTELTMVFLSSDAIADYTLNLIGIYGKIDGEADDTLIYVCVCNEPFNIHKNLSLEFVFKIQETLTKGELTVEINENYACPISHLSDNYRHIFIQTNTNTSEATVSSGTEHTFLNGQPILFIPRVNLTTSAKLNIAGQKYNLRYKNIASNYIAGTFLANHTYCLSYESSTHSFVYSEYHNIEVQNGALKFWNGTEWKTAMAVGQLQVQNGVLHYYSNNAWHSTMAPGIIYLFARSSAPTGYLLCNGWEYNTTDYPELFSVIGYTFGGSGSKFNVPNLAGKFPLGVNGSHSLGKTGGSDKASISINNIPSHNHKVTINHIKYRKHKFDESNQINAYNDYFPTNPEGVYTFANAAGFGQGAGLLDVQYAAQTEEKETSGSGTSENTGNGTPFDIINPYLALNYYISTGKSLL